MTDELDYSGYFFVHARSASIPKGAKIEIKPDSLQMELVASDLAGAVYSLGLEPVRATVNALAVIGTLGGNNHAA